MDQADNQEKEIRVAEPVKAEVVELETPKLEKLVQHSVTVALQAQSYRGPMPLPEHLAQYDKIVPGAARMIVEEFQANSKHSREMDRLGLGGMIDKDRRAQYIAGGLVLIGFFLIYQLAMAGHDRVAIAVAVGLLGTVVTAFLTGTVKLGKRDDDEDKEDKDGKDE